MDISVGKSSTNAGKFRFHMWLLESTCLYIIIYIYIYYIYICFCCNSMRLWWEWFSKQMGNMDLFRVGLADRATCVDGRPHCVHWTLGGLFMLYEHGSIIRWCAGICWDLAFGCMMTVGSVCDLKLCLTMQGLLTWDFSEWVVPLFKYIIAWLIMASLEWRYIIPSLVYFPDVCVIWDAAPLVALKAPSGGQIEPQRLDRLFSSDFKEIEELSNGQQGIEELRSLIRMVHGSLFSSAGEPEVDALEDSPACAAAPCPARMGASAPVGQCCRFDVRWHWSERNQESCSKHPL